MINAIILDDEQRGSKLLEKKLEVFKEELTVIASYNNAIVALAEINHLKVDVLFLDIEMPELNGFEFIEKLGAFDFEVIFVTAYNSYTLNALRVNALDYLLKPIDEDELHEAISRLIKKVGKKHSQKVTSMPPLTLDKRIALPTSEGVHLVKKSDILRVEAMSNYSIFFLLENKKIMISKTLKEYENLLTDSFFVRVNRSCIVNLEYVVKYKRGDGGTLEMSDGHEIEVSPQRKEDIITRLL